MEDFKPSQIYLGVPPLVGTMEKSEREYAAACLVMAMATNGDTWRPIGPQEMGPAPQAAIDSGVEPWPSLNRNPFFRPDFDKLADGEYARTLVPGDRRSAIEFTPKGIEAMRKWLKP